MRASPTPAATPGASAWAAVSAADYETLETLCRAHGRAATRPWDGRLAGHPVTALGAACRAGDTRAVRLLLDAGADPGQGGDEAAPCSPMASAIKAGSLGCVRMLLDRAPRVRAPEDEDWADLAVRWTRTQAGTGPR